MSDFSALVAQLIPAILIAFAVERRFNMKKRQRPSEAAARTAVLILLGLGEVAAVVAAHSKAPQTWLVSFACATGLLGLVTYIQLAASDWLRSAKQKVSLKIWVSHMVAAVAAVGVLAVIIAFVINPA